MQSRKVYNKLRQLFTKESEKEAEKAILPNDCETLEICVNQLLGQNDDNESDADFRQSISSAKVKDLFGPVELQLLKEGFSRVIAKRSVKDEYIDIPIKNRHAAAKFSKMMQRDTIKNPIKY